jgi:hypothetical protein
VLERLRSNPGGVGKRDQAACWYSWISPPSRSRRTRPRTLSPRQGDEAQRIEAVLSSPEGQALYRRRQQIVEPVFAHTKFIRRTDRFLRRGLAACQAEWQLIAATHNLLKLWRAGLSQAGSAIPGPLAG